MRAEEHEMQRLQQVADRGPIGGVLADLFREFPQAEVYLVGGAVRDALLGRPVHDFDYVIRAVGQEQLEKFLTLHGKVNFVGENFGVFKFYPKGTTHEIDIAMPRTERARAHSQGGYRDFEIFSNPWVPIVNDLERRDFTVNAMAYDLRAHKLIDPFLGLNDLHSELIHAVGDPKARFEEDLTRLMRAVRLATELGFEIESGTASALRSLAPRLNERREVGSTWLSRFTRADTRVGPYVVAREMIGREFMKALCADAGSSLTLMHTLGILKQLSMSLDAVYGTKLDDLHRALSELSQRKSSFDVILAAVLSPLGRLPALAFFDEYTLANIGGAHRCFVDRTRLNNLLRGVEELKAKEVNEFSANDFEKIFGSASGHQVLELFSVIIPWLEVDERAVMTTRLQTAHERLGRLERLFGRQLFEVPQLLSGSQVVELSGSEGRHVGEILHALREAQLNDEIKTEEQAISFVKKRFGVK